MIRRPPRSTLFPYTNALPIYVCLFSGGGGLLGGDDLGALADPEHLVLGVGALRAGHVDRQLHVPSLLRVRLDARSEEHTSELQSRLHLVCRLLLEKKKKKKGQISGTGEEALSRFPTTYPFSCKSFVTSPAVIHAPLFGS